MSTDTSAFRVEAAAEPAPAGSSSLRFRWQVGPAPVGQVLVVDWDSTGRAGALHQLAGRQAPLWALEAAPVTTSGDVTLVGTCAPGTASAVQQARDADRRAPLGVLADGWSGAVVVQCPATALDFDAVLGTAAGAEGSAAVAWPLGSGDEVAVHVVLSPSVALSDDSVALVLRHEIVHVATRSYRWKTTWITEGLADAIAVDDAYRVQSDAAVRADVAAHGLPAQLPTEQDFASTSPDRLNLVYGYARMAVEALAEHIGWERADSVLQAWSQGSTEPSDGVSQADLLRWWQTMLGG